MKWFGHCWALLTGSAQKGARVELLETVRLGDEREGRSEGAEHLNTLLGKYERRKPRREASTQ